MFERVVQVSYVSLAPFVHLLSLVISVFLCVSASLLKHCGDVSLLTGGDVIARSQDWLFPGRYSFAVGWPEHTETNFVPCGTPTPEQNVWQGSWLCELRIKTVLILTWWHLKTAECSTPPFLHEGSKMMLMMLKTTVKPFVCVFADLWAG